MENKSAWKELKIQTSDGVQIAARLYSAANPSRVVIINSATAVLQGIYTKFATYLASEGATVITYDYRGIGESKYRSLKEETASMADWALQDAQAILNFVERNFPQLPISVVGHSFGGQCIGILDGIERVDKILFVGAQVGYWKNFPVRSWPFLLMMWHVLFPLLIKIIGYFPSARLGMGENLPRNVAWQWRTWCLQPDYLFNEVGTALPNNYGKVKAQGTVFFISDDTYAPEKAIRKLLPRYPKMTFTEHHFTPEQLGVKSIGHFGVFRSQFAPSIWPLMKKALL